jgi:CHAT domain-containing protein/Tfp pilus assembly protein PilF
VTARGQDPGGVAKPDFGERDRLWDRARGARAAGRLGEAIGAAEAMLAIERSALPAGHLDLAVSLNWLADAYLEREDFAAAIRARRESLAILRARRGAGHWTVVDARLALEDAERLAALDEGSRRKLDQAKRLTREMIARFKAGDFDEALARSRQVQAIRAEVLSERHPSFATGLNFQALIQEKRKDDASARRLYERCLALREEVLGARHPDTATTLNGLAMLIDRLGDTAAARPLYERTLALRREVLGARHVDTIQSLNNLALFLYEQRDYQAARPVFQEVVAARTAVLGERHEETMVGLENLAGSLKAQGDLAAARPLYERALALREDVQGNRHPAYGQALLNLAHVLAMLKDFGAARIVLERRAAYTLAVHGQGHPEHISSLCALAAAHRRLHEDAAARRLLEQALARRERAEGREGRALPEILIELADVIKSQGDLAGARADYQRAMALLERAKRDSEPLYAQCANDLGTVLLELDELAPARRLLERAVAVRKSKLGEGDPLTAASLNDLGMILARQGDLDGARALLEEAMAIRGKVLGERHAAYGGSLNNLAVIRLAQGDLAGARSLQQRGLAIIKEAEGPRSALYATALSNSASRLEEVGDYAGARPLFEQAVTIREQVLSRHDPEYAAGLTSLAINLMMQGDLDRAGPLFERAQMVYEEALGPRHPAYATGLANQAVLNIEKKDYAAARALLERALAIRKAAGDEDSIDVAKDLHSLAQASERQGALDEALPLFERSLTIHIRRKGERDPTSVLMQYDLALLYHNRGDLARAGLLIRRALEGIDRDLDLAASGLSERQQLAMARYMRRVLDAYLSVAVDAREGGEAVYPHVLAWKGAIFLRQRRARGLRRIAAGGRPEAVRLTTDLQGVARELAAMALAGPGSGRREDWERRVADLTDRKESLEADLAGLDADSRTALSRGRPSPTRVREALPPGVALVDLLEYTRFRPRPDGFDLSALESQLVAFVVRRDHPIERVDLGPLDPIHRAIDAWRTALVGGIVSTASVTGDRPASAQEDPAAELRRRVWQPLEAHLEGASTVLISPDGLLARVPWAALPGRRVDSFLLEERAIALAPIPQLLPGGQARQDPPAALLLAGGIDFGASAGPTENPSSLLGRAGALTGFGPLPGATREVAAIRDLFRARHPKGAVTELRGDRATEAAFRREAGRHRWLHLATHGFFAPPALLSALDPDRGAARHLPMGPLGGRDITRFHPGLLSGLALAGANRGREVGRDDGILTSLEVAELDLEDVDLVALSACETGLGASAGGEGLLGLQRAFQEAGARAVVASLWKVRDEATRALMERFYRNLWQQGMGRLEALRAAQLETLRSARQSEGDLSGRGLLPLDGRRRVERPGPASASDWAGFVLSGDWR